MFVIEVIPLLRGSALNSLSYFAASTYEPGSLVTIPIRGKTVSGIVVSSEAVSATKTALKAATFSLRKLPAQPNVQTLSPSLIAAAQQLQNLYPATLGALLFALLPADIRNGTVPYPPTHPSLSDEDTTPYILAALRNERYITYQGIIRSAFAHRGSVMLVVPHSAAARYAYEHLAQGIADRVVLFTPHQNRRERAAAYTTFSDHSHTTLTIATPAFAYLERADHTHIIIDEAGNPAYQNRTERPYLDHRDALKALAKIAKRSLILGDAVTRTEDEVARRNDLYQTYHEHPKRLSPRAVLTIIEQTDTPKNDTPFQLFSPALATAITNTIDTRQNVFLLAARRGLAPVVACLDCGHLFRCPDSGAPYSLLRTHDSFGNEQRWFVSSTSGRRVRAADTCSACGSWRLRERGIGIQYIEDECKKLFPHTPLTVFDHTTASTHKRALSIGAAWKNSKGSILLGTQMALPYLPENTARSIIVSLDAVRAVPTWRADEQLFRLLLELRERTEKEVIVQTRTTPDSLIEFATHGAVERFHDEEIALRTDMRYPPHCHFTILTWQGSAAAVTTTEDTIKQTLAPHQSLTPSFYTNPHSIAPKIIRHCFIRTTPGDEHRALMDTLRNLPPYIAVMINPDRIV